MASSVVAKLQVEGKKEFENAFNQATASVKALDSSVKVSTAAFKNASTSTDALREKENLLTEEIKEQTKIVQLNEEMMQKIVAAYGEGSTEANKFEVELNKSKLKLEQLNTSLSDNEAAITKVQTRWIDAGQSIASSAEKIGSKLKWLSAGASVAFTAMFKSASDLEENFNKTEVVFGDMADGIKAWSETTLNSYGIAQSSALEMISLYGDMATSMGLTTEQAALMGKELVGRAGDLASFKNVSQSVAQTGLNAIFTGETESLKKFGVVMTEANLNAYALAAGFTKTYKEMDQAEKVLLRYQYVMDATNNAQGDFVNTSDGAANSIRVARAALEEAAATLGEEIIPLAVPLIEEATEIIKGINALDEGTKKLIVTGVGLVAIASPVLTVGGKLLGGVLSLAKVALPALTTAFGTTEVAGTAAMTGISASAAGLTTVLGGLAAAVGLVVAEWKILDALEDSKNRSLQEQRNASLTAGRTRISAADASYYNANDLVAIGYGDNTQYYVRNGSKMTSTGRLEYLDRQRELDSVTNNYNMDINVSQISDLQDLLDMANTAQLYDRMGTVN